MAGRVKELIEELVRIRSQGRAGTEHFVRAHLALNGIDPGAHSEHTADDQAAISRLQKMIREFNEKGSEE